MKIIINATTQEQRDRIFEEIHNKPIGDEALCRDYECEKQGECDIRINVYEQGPINKEIYDFPQKYPGVTVEEWEYSDWFLDYHRIYHKDYWEEVYTVEDAIDDIDYCDYSFDPCLLDINTFRKVYNYDGHLVLEESKIVPYPIESMSRRWRYDYENWKEDPKAWEERHDCNHESMPSLDYDDEDLPF